MNLSRYWISWYILGLICLLVTVLLAECPVNRFQVLLLFVVLLVVLFLPGFLLLEVIGERRSFGWFECIPLSLCFSLLALTIPTFLGYLFHMSLIWIIYVNVGLTFALLLVSFVLRIRRDGESNRELTPPAGVVASDEGKRLGMGLLFAVIILSVFGLYFGGALFGDALLHVADVRKLEELPKIALESPFIKGWPTNRYGYNVWYVAMAILARASHIDPVDLWLFLPTVLVGPVMILPLFAFSRTLFQDKRIAYVVVFLYILWNGLLNHRVYSGRSHTYWAWSISPYPSCVARDLVLVTSLLFTFKYIRSRERKYLLLFAFLGLTLASIHPLYFFYLLLILVSFWLFIAIFRGLRAVQSWKLIAIAGSASVPALFYVLWLVDQFTPIVNPGNPSFAIGAVGLSPSILLIGGNIPVVLPSLGLWQNPLRQIAFLLSPLLLLHVKKKDWALYLLSSVAVITFALFNPPLLFILRRFEPALNRVARANEVVPYTLIAGLFLYKALPAISSRFKAFFSGQERRQRCVLLSLLALAALMLSAESLRYIAFGPTAWKEKLHIRRLFGPGDTEFIRGRIAPRSVVLTDPPTSLTWPLYFPHYVVAVHPHGVVYLEQDFDQTQRLEDVEMFFANDFDNASLKTLDKYDVDYLVINKQRAYTKIHYGGHEEILRLVYESDKWIVYEHVKEVQDVR